MTANETEASQPQGVAPPADPAQTDDPDQLREQIGTGDEDEVPEGRRLAEQGNTDAKLFVPGDSPRQGRAAEELLEEAEASGEGGPEGGGAA